MSNFRFLPGLLVALLATTTTAAPLSKSQSFDFYADVPSRNLQGMASRSDGRLLPGPAVSPAQVKLSTDLLWTLAVDGNSLLIGTGPDGKVLAVNPNRRGEIVPTLAVDLPETHVFAVARLPNGDLLAGTSPQGTLVLVRNGEVIARAALPVDSVFDFVVLRGDAGKSEVLVATGNPGRIYRVDLATFATTGDQPDKLVTESALAARGITVFGEIRDRNIRRLLQLPDGRVIAGSAPKGNVYEFSAVGGAARILVENRNAEVCDLLPWDKGFFAALTFSGGTGEARVNRPKPAKTEEAPAPESSPGEAPVLVVPVEPAKGEQFSGRSQLLWFPDGGFPETAAARNHAAFYRLARHDDLVLIAGGEQGELLGFDPANRRSLTFPGVASAQMNGLVPATKIPGAFYAIANNPAELSLVNFPGADTHSADSRRIDLGAPAILGLLRFGAGTKIDPDLLKVELRTSFGSDEAEGWTSWRQALMDDGGWRVADLSGRYVQIRVSVDASVFEIDKADLYFLPENHRPQLQDFRLFSPNFSIVPAPAPADRVVTTLGQLLQPVGREDDMRRNPLLSSQIVPQPGAQVAYWTVIDPDGDNLVSTFSLRLLGQQDWTDIAVETSDPYLQFDISHLPEGIYRTRLLTQETGPRPVAERLSVVFETDDLLVDRTPPLINDVQLKRESGRLRITVAARDALSRLAGVEVALNNGLRETVEQPDDGILDGRSESFSLDLPANSAAGATSVEVIVYDIAGNSSARRLPCP